MFKKNLWRAGAPVLCVSLIAALTPAAAFASPARVSVTANATDKAFVREMVPHHQMAKEMAGMALMGAGHPQIKTLAKNIISAQTAEITRLRKIARSIGVTPEKMSMGGKMTDQMMKDLETLRVSMSRSSMNMDMSELEGAKPFDRKFIDMMIAHHAGAILMARAEISRGANPTLRSIATGIIGDQAKEIREMNSWRVKWYGKASPAGGVPGS
jgi:uncharacterized protein (DUF305 family)